MVLSKPRDTYRGHEAGFQTQGRDLDLLMTVSPALDPVDSSMNPCVLFEFGRNSNNGLEESDLTCLKAQP